MHINNENLKSILLHVMHTAEEISGRKMLETCYICSNIHNILKWCKMNTHLTCVSRNCIWRYRNVYDVARIPTDFILAPRSDWLSTGIFSKQASPYRLFFRKYLWDTKKGIKTYQSLIEENSKHWKHSF